MEYGITAKPSTLGNPTSNVILEWIHQVLVNLARACSINQTYIDEYGPWLGILAAAAFENFSTINGLKGYSPGLILFGCDMNLLIKIRWIGNCFSAKSDTN